jgi:hypothetical protein
MTPVSDCQRDNGSLGLHSLSRCFDSRLAGSVPFFRAAVNMPKYLGNSA